MKSVPIRTKRVYEPAAHDDGKRFLVERLWPRGLKKDALHMDGWIKHAAPSDALRRWFGHDPAKWGNFNDAIGPSCNKSRTPSGHYWTRPRAATSHCCSVPVMWNTTMPLC